MDFLAKGSEKTDRLNAHETGQTCWKGIRIDPFNRWVFDGYPLMIHLYNGYTGGLLVST